MQTCYMLIMARDIPVVRPVRAADLGAVLQLVARGGSGLTNLPPDRETLRARISAAEGALVDPAQREAGAPVMLVAELAGTLLATGLIFARIGVEWPFYSYRITRQAAVSRAVGRARTQRLLNLVNDFDGECEVGGLFVDPGHRGLALGRTMARARYLFMARHRAWFGDRVIAELRGYQDAEGRSPVWDAIGGHFYAMEFAEADRHGAIAGNQFIVDLGPRYPVYLSMLPASAQAAIGRPHDDGRAAHAMLLAEGFVDDGYVDIFDGGPTLVSRIDAVRTVREAVQLRWAGIAEGGVQTLVSAGEGANFRVAAGLVTRAGSGNILLEPALAAALHPGEGEELLLAPAEGVS